MADTAREVDDTLADVAQNTVYGNAGALHFL